MLKKAPILIAAFVLGSFAVGGVGLVAMTHSLTDVQIAENQREAMLAKFRAIVPPERIGNDPLNDRIEVAAPDLLGGPVTEVFRVRDGDVPVALVLRPVVPDGYAGPIKLLVAVMADGTLGGVRVIEHHETPGLGDKIEERKDDWIIRTFNDRSLTDPAIDDWGVKRDGGVFDQFTGATITPRSIVSAVKNTLVYVEQEGARLYQEPAIGAEPVVMASAAEAAASPAAPAEVTVEPVTELPGPDSVATPDPATGSVPAPVAPGTDPAPPHANASMPAATDVAPSETPVADAPAEAPVAPPVAPVGRPPAPTTPTSAPASAPAAAPASAPAPAPAPPAPATIRSGAPAPVEPAQSSAPASSAPVPTKQTPTEQIPADPATGATNPPAESA